MSDPRTGRLKINGNDAFLQYGVWLEGVSPFRQFAPVKERTENKSPLRHGKEVVPSAAMVDERDITITFCMGAASESQLESRLDAFENVLRSGELDITLPEHNSKHYYVYYVSCTQFTEFNGRLAKFILKLNEPNPNDRAAHGNQ